MDKVLYLLRRFAYYFYGEKFYKRLDFAWQTKLSRLEIIELFIKNNNYKSYLEIGCHKDDVFSKINIKKVLNFIIIFYSQQRTKMALFWKI